MSIRTFAIAAIILGISSAASAAPTLQQYEFYFRNVKGDLSSSEINCIHQHPNEDLAEWKSGTCRMGEGSMVCSIILSNVGAWSCQVALPTQLRLPARYNTDTCLDVYPLQVIRVASGEQLVSNEFRIDSKTCAYVIDQSSK